MESLFSLILIGKAEVFVIYMVQIKLSIALIAKKFLASVSVDKRVGELN